MMTNRHSDTALRCVKKPPRYEAVAGICRFPLLPLQEATSIFSSSNWLEALTELLQRRADVRAAICVASRSFSEASEAWLDRGQEPSARVAVKALMYVLRMTTRSTPFGMFSAMASVGFGDATNVRVDLDALRTHTRPDAAWLDAYLLRAAQAPEAKENLPLRLNNLILESGERLVITDVSRLNRLQNGLMEYPRKIIHNTDGVERIRTTYRGRPYRELRDELAVVFKCSNERIDAFVDNLRAAGLLLEPLTTTQIDHPVEAATTLLQTADESAASQLNEVIHDLRLLDAIPVRDRRPYMYGDVEQRMLQLQNVSGSTIQVDTIHTAEGTLTTNVVDAIARLAELSVRSSPGFAVFAKMRERFERHYEGAERLVPLLELVDPETGIDVGFGGTRRTDQPQRRYDALYGIYAEALAHRQFEVELPPSTVDAILPPVDQGMAPPAFEVAVRLISPSTERLDGGDFLVFPCIGMAGSNGPGKTIGRFGHILQDARISTLQRRATDDDDVIHAELVYSLPNARSANVCSRARVLRYELHVGLDEPVPPEIQVLSPAEIDVGVDRDRFFLWSRTHQKEVRLYEHHTLTFPDAPGLIRFLAALAKSPVGPVPFQWGPLIASPFLPRLREGRVVVSPAQWRLSLSALKRAPNPRQELRAFADRWMMPELVALTTGETYVVVNVRHETAQDLIAEACAAEDKYAIFVEFPEGLDVTWLRSADGAHVSEIVATLRDNQFTSAAGVRVRSAIEPMSERSWPPGSSWSYLTLQCRPSDIDEIVLRFSGAIGPYRDDGMAEQWFFVRYSTPKHHVRLRVRARDDGAERVRDAVREFAELAFREGLAINYSFDTYVRELERYGGARGLSVAEELFAANSDDFVERLRQGTSTGHFQRFGEAVFAAVDLLGALYAPSRLDDWLRQRDRRIKLSSPERQLVRRVCTDVELMGTRTRYEALARRLRELEERHELGRGFDAISGSLVHMHCNRFGLGDDEWRLRAVVNAVFLSIKGKACE